MRAMVQLDPIGVSRAGTVEAVIEDDGWAWREAKGKPGFGLRLVGIRERVMALGGQVTFCQGERGMINEDSRGRPHRTSLLNR